MSQGIRSVMQSKRTLFNPKDIPKELIDDVDIKRDVLASARPDVWSVLYSWYNQKYPTLKGNQTCKDVISGGHMSTTSTSGREMYYAAKLALCGYAFPYYFSQISTHLHMKNHQFVRYLQSFVSETTYLAYHNMDEILEKRITVMTLPDNTSTAGFYVRTPIRIWNRAKRRIYRLPSWAQRDKLLKQLVIGNVNFYVLRRNVADGFECQILFRGTSNEFNGSHQYGKNMRNTQLYRVPQYDPVKNQFHPGGDQAVPLFYFYYCALLEDAWPHLMQCLEWLHASHRDCKRILVTGHSMGGALTLTFCYLLKLRQPKLWDKCFFRSFASPLCCNDAAAVQLEQWIIDSMQADKYLEVVNTDDFVNVQYYLSQKAGVQSAVQGGTSKVGGWLVNNMMDGKSEEADPEGRVNRMLRVIQIYPEIAFAAFMSGALDAQSRATTQTREAGVRLGVRHDETKYHGTSLLRNTYNSTLKVYFCTRNVDWQSEYMGKAHAKYADLNMNVFWAPLRMYEDNLYNYYHREGLRKHNNLVVVGLFPESDRAAAEKLIHSYKPRLPVPPLLSIVKQLPDSNKAPVPRKSRKPSYKLRT